MPARHRGANPPAFNSAVVARRVCFTLDRPELSRTLVRLACPRKLPTVLSAEEVARLLAATACLNHRAAPTIASQALTVGDIDSQRMLIRLERGKGGPSRQAVPSPDLLGLLRAWWQEGHRQGVMRPGGWLFPGQHPDNPITTRQLHCVVQAAARATSIAGRDKPPIQENIP